MEKTENNNKKISSDYLFKLDNNNKNIYSTIVVCTEIKKVYYTKSKVFHLMVIF
jgi:hypothetical protein